MPIAFRDRCGVVMVVAYKDGPTKTTKQQIHALEYELGQRGEGFVSLALENFRIAYEQEFK